LQIEEEEDDGTDLRAIPAVLRLDSRTSRKTKPNDLEALIEETIMPVVQEDWREA
jgi:hypothetical protein